MAIGERIHFFRILRGMTQKYLGTIVGFPERSADVRLAQYETGTRKPKAELTAALAQALDVSPHALDVPDIDSYIGLMHTLFTLEDLYGLTVSESEDGEICLKVDTSKGKDAHELRKLLYAWKEQADKLSSEEISKDKYDEWRYHTRSLIPLKHGQKSHHRHLATLWSKCSKTNSNQINKYDKKALSHEFLPTAKGFLNNMDLLVAQPPVNHSLTLKPPDYKNNGSHATVINLLSKDF